MIPNAFPDVLKDHLPEEPVRGAARDTLHDAAVVIDSIDGADPPAVVIAVLGIVQADLPPVAAVTPPLA